MKNILFITMLLGVGYSEECNPETMGAGCNACCYGDEDCNTCTNFFGSETYSFHCDGVEGTYLYGQECADNPCDTWIDCIGMNCGTHWESDCGCVSVNNSGDECDDCFGIPDGEAVYDCAGECGGSEYDFDTDGVCDGDDNCPADINEDQADSDFDFIGDVCDNCVEVYNPDQLDSDFDFIGDACESCDDCPEIEGCMDSTANNYNPEATINDGTCEYADCEEVFNEGYELGAQSGDLNLDGLHNILDIVRGVDMILNP